MDDARRDEDDVDVSNGLCLLRLLLWRGGWISQSLLEGGIVGINRCAASLPSIIILSCLLALGLLVQKTVVASWCWVSPVARWSRCWPSSCYHDDWQRHWLTREGRTRSRCFRLRRDPSLCIYFLSSIRALLPLCEWGSIGRRRRVSEDVGGIVDDAPPSHPLLHTWYLPRECSPLACLPPTLLSDSLPCCPMFNGTESQ